MRLCYHCMHQIADARVQICPNCKKSLRTEQHSAKFLTPGTVLQGKYIVGEPLGAGGFGNTYIGWNKVLLQKVAIKEFYPEQYSTRTSDSVTVSVTSADYQSRFRLGLQQFLEEARSIAALQDIKGVVKISNFFEENGTGYIVMEYLEGMDVKTILKKSGEKKDYEWCRRVILTVLHTLRDIHKRGVLHRDIAPDNVFITNDGIIKLIDFGAARHASATVHQRSEIVLKVGYAPIEQYSRDAKQGAYTDLYAVAALFYRMLTGQKPIPANERLGQQDPLLSPSDMGIQIPEQAEMAMMVCLNVRPEYRLQCADELMEALDGQYFVPVYDKEWIFPAVTEEKQGLFQSLSRLSMAARAAICLGVICLIGAMVAGGVAIAKNRQNRNVGIQSGVNQGMIRLEDYTGKSYEEVVSLLQQKGLQNIADPVYDYNAAPEGTVTGQSVPASAEISLDETISFSVSGGNHVFTMPDFSAFSESQVIQYFIDKNFDVLVEKNPYKTQGNTQIGQNGSWVHREGLVRIHKSFSDQVTAGGIIEQGVPAGQLYDASSGITITCSMGPEADYLVSMPNLKGMSKNEVKERISYIKLKDIVKIKYKKNSAYSDTVAAGNVLKQSIAPGTQINFLSDQGKKLTLYLSRGAKVSPTSKPKSSGQSNGSKAKVTPKSKKKSGSDGSLYLGPQTKKKTSPKKKTTPKKKKDDTVYLG